MCGIAAWIGPERAGMEALVLRMLRAQAHRGPDGAGLASADPSGLWSTAFAREVGGLPRRLADRATCVLGHNWLAIMDQSPRAGQPMIEGGVGLVFNGEIYNYVELREELKAQGERFETDSDTEVLLRIWRREGIGGMSRLRGMFAFIVYDAATQTLWAVRDFYGIKPIYGARVGEGFLFASEIRTLHAEGGVRRRLRDSAVVASAAAGINKFGDSQTLYEDIEELPPGHYWKIDRDGRELHAYHEFPALSEDADDETGTALLRDELETSVRLHLRGTRTIASCLSGGLDSSSVVTMIGRHLEELKQPFAAYSIFSGAAEDNELPLAREVCANSGVGHRVFEYQGEISARDALEMAVAYEEPIHVIGPINQYLLLRHIAGDGVTVVLDGQGGDELLSAYVQYVPVLLRRMEERGTDTRALRSKLEVSLPMPIERLALFQKMFHSPREWVRAFIWDVDFLGLSHEFVDELPETKYYLTGGGEWGSFREATYLRRELQYLLRQEDRLGMWFGLECRVPFVDDPLILVAARLRAEFLLQDGYLKYPYRKMMTELPSAVRWNIKKRGFWETHESRFPWMDAVSQRLCFESSVLRRLFPKLEANWGRMSFDQRWRLVQHAVLERCASRQDLDGLPLG